MTEAAPPHKPPSATARMAILAGWGFLLSKLLVIEVVLGGPWDRLLPVALLTSLGADGGVLAVIVVAGALAERAGAPRVWRVVLPAIGVLLALWTLANVILVVEIGRPANFGMLGIGVGGTETATMLASRGGRLALGGIALYALTAWPVVRLLERRPVAARPALGALIAYALLAVGLIRAVPQVASTYGLHRNAVAEVVLGISLPTSRFARAESSAFDVTRFDFAPPEDPTWTAQVAWNRAARPKHVVMWFAESTGARYTSLFDPNATTTPNLLRLKDHALRFTRYYSNCPHSEKALWGILYGMYPYPSALPMAAINPRIAAPSLMQILHSRGWRTGFFTGALLGFGDKQKLLSERGFEIMVDGDTVPDRAKYWHDGWGVEDAAIVHAALDWVDQRPDPDQSQLVVMVPIIPHQPYNLPPSVKVGRGDPRWARYQAGVHYSDDWFGRMVDAFTERGLADDTLFVYVGDHGDAFEQHPGNRAHVSFIYEENVHVPLMFIHRGLFPTEQVSERMGSHADLLPTIFELIGEPVPPEIAGRSLVGDDFGYRPAFFGAFVRDHLGGLRDGDFKYIYNFDTGYEEVFDLHADPLETANIVGSVDATQVATWRRWVIDYQAHQAALIESYPALGPPYLQRAVKGMRVAVEDGDQRVECKAFMISLGKVGCPQAPTTVAVGIAKENLAVTARECISVHPPPSGSLVLEFDSLQPPPAMIGAGLVDSAREAGGTPLEVTWHIADMAPITMTLGDARADAYKLERLPRIGDGVAGVPARVEVRSDDWSNRQGCLILAP